MNIKEKAARTEYPIRMVQFGEGNFLRAFVDYMLDIANEKGVFGGSIAIVKPIAFGNLDSFYAQDNFYTVILRGKENGKTVNDSRIITSVSKVLDCAEDYDEYMALASLDTLRFVVSNTTEAGIVLDDKDSFDGLPNTYPGKLTKFLYERYTVFSGEKDKGLIILPVELIEDNGKKLRECVLTLADIWNLPPEFKDWVKENNIFCSTLVDRIVTGYPKGEAENICKELGYDDRLIDVGEPFALWIIESERNISAELPLDKIGLPVVFTDNQKPYRERKVRILNGAHTSSVLAGYLYGLDIVRDCMNDEVMGKFIRNVVMDEIVPKDYYKNNGKLPRLITFSFAALAAFYSSNDLRNDGLYAERASGEEYVIRDDSAVLKFFAQNSGSPCFIKQVCSNMDFWGEDLTRYSGFTDTVSYWYEKILHSTADALKEVIG